jgi:hypothetical protein
MATHEPANRDQLSIEAIPPALLDDPLAYIFADHFRQRRLCAALRHHAETGHVDRPEAEMITAYLRRDLVLHYRDEDEDLFPLLLRRALPEDDLAAALGRLAQDHRQSRQSLEAIIGALTGRPAEDPVKLGRGMCKLMLAYAASEHLHMAAENGIVLAIARIRLRREDLKAMSRTMKERRGVPA